MTMCLLLYTLTPLLNLVSIDGLATVNMLENLYLKKDEALERKTAAWKTNLALAKKLLL